ncbi:glycerophosphoryl diester phosphodiesterase [Endozoicomonas sp. (ex Bugula neritina AB1)]|nr:glycerophosphoryl diester phosphodiesterase [Endozoicomonas sp. (ex Bugula neritina AB1)]
MKKVFAHRGVSSLAPENTLAAFRLTKQFGVKWIEADADILPDGTVIIIHDSTLDRCSDHAGLATNLDKDSIKKVDAGSWFSDEFAGEPIPTLDDLIELVNQYQLNLNLELKSCRTKQLNDALIAGVVEGLKKLDSDRELIVSCFNHLVLSHFKQAMPEVEVACLFEKATLWEDWPAIMEMVGANTIHPENEGLTQDSVRSMKEHGYNVHVWTVNDRARINELFNWGVDGVFTDLPQLMPAKHRF